MTWQYTPYTIPLLLIAIILTLIALRIWMSGCTPTIRLTALVLLGGVVWLTTVMLELACSDMQWKIFWNKTEYFGAVTVPLGWLWLTLRILGYDEWTTPGRFAKLAVVPALTLLAVWTNEWHGLIWSSQKLVQIDSFNILVNTHGVVYWLYYLYAAIVVTCAVVLLLRAVLRERDLYRGQAIAFLISGLVPLLVSIIDAIRPDLFGGITQVPIAMVFSVTALAWGVMRFRAGDIVPIARKLVLDGISDAVLVFDLERRLVDLNAAAQNLLHVRQENSIGKPIADIWAEAAELLGSGLYPSGRSVRMDQQASDVARTLDVRISPVVDWRGTVIGSTIVARDITELTTNAERLQAALQEKNVLLKEIHHRVKNNLQIISSLLNLQSGSIDDPLSLAKFQDSQDRVRSMALIHEHLYRSDDLARIDFGKYLNELAGSLVQTYRTRDQFVSLKLETDTVMLDIDTAIPSGLIVNELVSNALKHAYPDHRAGTIIVQLCQDRVGRVHLSVRDDGVGIPTDVDYRNTASLGMQLVNSLCRQLDATMEMHNASGTTFSIDFPVTALRKE